MLEQVAIQPMSERLVVWRCLHSGPICPAKVDCPAPDERVPWETLRARNVPLLQRLIAAYGTCAILALDGDSVVGFLRFYPKAIASLPEAGMLCMQQEYPAGPSGQLVERAFPGPGETADRTLVVHCLMAGSSRRADNHYMRRGIGTRLVRGLEDWAQAKSWRAVEAGAYENLPIVYEITGQAGRLFWERLGYRAVAAEVEPAFSDGSPLAMTVRRQALDMGIDANCCANRYTMRRDLR